MIKQHMTHKEVMDCWGDTANATEKSMVYLTEKETNDLNDQEKSFEIQFLHIKKKEDQFILRFHGNLASFKDASIVGITKLKKKLKYPIIELDDDKITIDYDKNLILLYLVHDEKKISNNIFVNNPSAIAARITGKQISDQFVEDKSGKTNYSYLFSLFKINIPENPKVSAPQKNLKKGFWRLPEYSGRHFWAGIINIDNFLKNRLEEFRRDQDTGDDNEPNHNDPQKNNETQANRPINDHTTSDTSYSKAVERETKKLLYNINSLETENKINLIDKNQWLQALFLLIHTILKEFKQLSELKAEEIDQTISMLKKVSRISIWIITKLNIDSFDEKKIEFVRCLFDIYQFITIYNYAYYREKNSYYKYDEECTAILKEAQLSLFYKHVLLSISHAPLKSSEHNLLSVKNLCSKLPRLKTSYKAYDLYSNKAGSIYDEIFEKTTICYIQGKKPFEKLLYIKPTNDEYVFETILGKEKRAGKGLADKIRRYKTIDC